jgi:hypothetical protein
MDNAQAIKLAKAADASGASDFFLAVVVAAMADGTAEDLDGSIELAQKAVELREEGDD